MLVKSIGSAVGAALLLSACGTLQGPSGEMVPATAATQMAEAGSQMIRVDGIGKRRGTNYLTFQPDGRVRAEVAGLGIGTDGSWAVEEGQLCLSFLVRGRECFPYQTTLAKGQTVDVRSDRGQTVRITMMTDPSRMLMAQAKPSTVGAGDQ